MVFKILATICHLFIGLALSGRSCELDEPTNMIFLIMWIIIMVGIWV